MIKAYRFALDPTPAQVEAFRSHCGAQRFVYNWALARVQANWRQRSAEASYGIPEDEQTPWIDATHFGLINQWNAVKEEIAPWWSENASKVYEAGCRNITAALRNRKHGAAFPRFKSKRSRPSCSLSDRVRLAPDSRHLLLPRIGPVRTCESTRKLGHLINDRGGRIKTATLSLRSGRWHMALVVECEAVSVEPAPINRIVGIDLGIKDLAVLSTGEHVPNKRGLDAALASLRRAQRVCARRQGPDKRTRSAPSNRWLKARKRARKLHWHVTAQRLDGLHKLSSRLIRDFDVIVIEDLHIAGLLKNRHLARSIYQLGLGQFRRQLEYKSAWAGVSLIVADRWFPSSKTCSGCGAVKTKLLLSERTYVCTRCGLVLDRDLNAARNLAALAAGTGELLREQPEGTDTRPDLLAGKAARPPREGSLIRSEPTSLCEEMAQ